MHLSYLSQPKFADLTRKLISTEIFIKLTSIITTENYAYSLVLGLMTYFNQNKGIHLAKVQK